MLKSTPIIIIAVIASILVACDNNSTVLQVNDEVSDKTKNADDKKFDAMMLGMTQKLLRSRTAWNNSFEKIKGRNVGNLAVLTNADELERQKKIAQQHLDITRSYTELVRSIDSQAIALVETSAISSDANEDYISGIQAQSSATVNDIAFFTLMEKHENYASVLLSFLSFFEQRQGAWLLDHKSRVGFANDNDSDDYFTVLLPSFQLAAEELNAASAAFDSVR